MDILTLLVWLLFAVLLWNFVAFWDSIIATLFLWHIMVFWYIFVGTFFFWNLFTLFAVMVVWLTFLTISGVAFLLLLICYFLLVDGFTMLFLFFGALFFVSGMTLIFVECFTSFFSCWNAFLGIIISAFTPASSFQKVEKQWVGLCSWIGFSFGSKSKSNNEENYLRLHDSKCCLTIQVSSP